MARSKFTLQPVLNYREQMVDVRKQELAARERVLWSEKQVLAALRMRLSEWRERVRTAGRERRLDPEHMRRHLMYLEQLEGRVRRQVAEVERLSAQVEAKRLELMEARQDQQALEKLKERFEARQREEELRQEGRILDEINVIRYHRQETGEA